MNPAKDVIAANVEGSADYDVYEKQAGFSVTGSGVRDDSLIATDPDAMVASVEESNHVEDNNVDAKSQPEGHRDTHMPEIYSDQRAAKDKYVRVREAAINAINSVRFLIAAAAAC